MSDQLINGLTPLSDAQVDDNTRELPIAAAVSGIAGYGTIGQLKLAMSTKRVKYVTTGSEGTTLTIGVLAGRYILAIFREGLALYEVSSSPDTQEFIWDSTNITLGLTVNPAGGERFLILYKNI